MSEQPAPPLVRCPECHTPARLACCPRPVRAAPPTLRDVQREALREVRRVDLAGVRLRYRRYTRRYTQPASAACRESALQSGTALPQPLPPPAASHRHALPIPAGCARAACWRPCCDPAAARCHVAALRPSLGGTLMISTGVLRPSRISRFSLISSRCFLSRCMLTITVGG